MRKTADLARGKWRGILLQLGVDERFLTGKHGPCPMCEGTDRFRWDNRNGEGSFICNQCGAGNGFNLLMQVKGWDFKTAAEEVDRVIGNVEAEAPKPKIDPRQRADMLNRLWSTGVPVCPGDMAHRYLSSRVRLPDQMPNCLRFTDRAPVPGTNDFLPAMLALVMDGEGRPTTIHRTFLGPNGKADIDTPRALMPGEVRDGAAVRLFKVDGSKLGIAEGIETAFAAAHKFQMPVWSAINARLLEKWVPPAGIEEVVVFGDSDPKFGGQAAAYALAHRLAARLHLKTSVEIPNGIGTDWADAA